MLRQLWIQNFVLIDELQLSFQDKMSAFCGETGAGKSIFIDAIALLCGARSSVDLIARGASKAVIEGIFHIPPMHPSRSLLVEYGYELEEDELLVTREIFADGKSSARLQRRQCPLSIIKEVMSLLVDIHCQQDNQYLSDPKSYLPLLDQFAQADAYAKAYQSAYQSYIHVKREYETFLSEKYNIDDLDMLQFQLQEIEQANIRVGECEELELLEKRYAAAEKIQLRGHAALEALKDNALDALYSASHELRGIQEVEELSAIGETVQSLYYQVQTACDDIAAILENVQSDEQQLNTVQDRLYSINKYKRKYGGSEEAIIERSSTLLEQIAHIENRQGYCDTMEAKLQGLLADAEKAGLALHEERMRKAKQLETAITTQLKDLDLPSAAFSIVFTPTAPSAQGMDHVAFLVAMNKGEELKPLEKTASGGERSRFMLGLKVIFTKLKHIRLVIFDEIDTGISGTTAYAIGKKMVQQSEDAQVFCVTHLAQVAASAQTQYHIEKQERNQKTVSRIHPVEKEARVRTLALLASGNETPAALEAARELLAKAQAV